MVRGFFIGTPHHKQWAMVRAAGKKRNRSERRPEPPNCPLDEEAINRESPVRRLQRHSESWPLAIPDNLNDTEPKHADTALVADLIQVWGLGRPMLVAIEKTYCPINGNSFRRESSESRTLRMPAHVRPTHQSGVCVGFSPEAKDGCCAEVEFIPIRAEHRRKSRNSSRQD